MLEIHKRITNCTNCTLCKNQQPLIHNTESADIFWVGLSAVKSGNKYDMPLSDSTNSGKLLYKIEIDSISKSYYRTNLVKCLPLDEKNKIRYPVASEMKFCVSNLFDEIHFYKPKVVILLGKPVAGFVLKKLGVNNFNFDNEFNYQTYKINNIIFVPVHHPSYILVYKRKKVDLYIKGIQTIISKSTIIPVKNKNKVYTVEQKLPHNERLSHNLVLNYRL